ncbi:hypothetical protein ACHWQZ_G003808 [Mnemiopsis leidyi]
MSQPTKTWDPLFSLQHWEEIVTHHTTDVESLPSFKRDAYIGTFTPDFTSLLNAPAHSDPFTVKCERDKRTGEFLYHREVLKNQVEVRKKSVKSFVSRPLAPGNEDAKGSAMGRCFWPGGMSDDEEDEEEEKEEIVDLVNNLLTIPPGFERGMQFEEADLAHIEDEPKNIQDLITKLDEVILEQKERAAKRKESTKHRSVTEEDSDTENDESPITHGGKFRWAIELDAESEVPDFYTQIGNLAYQFPFELDPFQKQAILRLHSHDNVMVAAHTSAGKTVVAEYAIALSNHHMTKVIYTAPIKALSNQKFRDFKEKFGEVGLLTGDIQINTAAPCLIMTTEILRSMLYNGSDITRDLEWVIFDEVHYINDVERGVVWEEVLIMLPEHVSVILLSATVANVTDFAEWVGNTKRKHVYVVKTPRRPVPLEHHLYTGNSDKTSKELFKIISANDKVFKNSEYERAKMALASRKKTKKDGNRPNKQADRNTVLSFVRMLERENLLPCVIFILSKNRINELAEGLHALDLTINKEKGQIREFITKCVGRLKGSDRDLPQIVFLKELMIRGIAVHHSGVLPLMKEVTEMLFEKGLIKLLLATETFAMGINMPTRTVVFDAIEKYDGSCKRLLATSEYIQMAGRAGRRGKDETGTVIILCKGKLPDHSDLLNMVQGKATDLSSRFKPTYNMILSVLKGKDLKVEELLKRSFAEYEDQIKARDYKRDRKELEKKLETLKPVSCQVCDDIKQFYMDGLIMMGLETDFKRKILNTAKASKSLHPGRLVIVSTPQFPFHIATIVNPNVDDKKDIRELKVIVLHSKEYSSGLELNSALEPWERTIVELQISPGVTCRSDCDVIRPESGDEPGFSVANISLLDLSCVLSQKVTADMESIKKNLQHMKFNPRNWDPTPIEILAKEMMQVKKPTEMNYDVRDMDGVELLENIKKQRGAMSKYTCFKCSTFNDHIRQTSELMYVEQELGRIAYSLSYQSLQFMPEFEVRVRVLKRLRYLGNEDQLKLKGKAACAMSTSELVVTELVFDNFFKDLEIEAIVAILSCMVFQQKRCSDPVWTPELEAAKKQFLTLAHRIVEAEVAEKLRPNDADFEEQFRFGLVEVVYRWAKGEEFSQIMQYTDVDEGTIVRCITRLDEVLRCIKDVARIVGDVDFEKKMEQASLTIKRDIVFAASLYVQ